MIIDENTLKEIFDKSKSVLLVEPDYKRKYPPLGLMKISTYFKSQNKRVEYTRESIQTDMDLICITTLFTYDFDIVVEMINEIKFLNPNKLIIIGGILASINPEKLNNLFDDVYIFKGFSVFLDKCFPDYSIDYMVEDRWNSYSYLFTTRGCPNKCLYCFVPKIEEQYGVIADWEKHINIERPFVMVYDNNITAYGEENILKLADFCIKNKLKVRLDNAIDPKYIDDKMAFALSRIPIEKHGYRTAFDRIEEDGIFQKSINILLKNNISKYNIMAYVLYNFTDTVKEANYRAKECLNLGITPYPACFQPPNMFSRKEKYISKNWTPKLTTVFRKFWLWGSLYGKYDFFDYCKTIGVEQFGLTDNDLSYLYL